MKSATVCKRPRSARAFTLIELTVVIIVVAILVSLVAVAGGRAIRSSRNAAERELLRSLKNAVEQFRQTFGFLPPLVWDNAPGGPVVSAGVRRPQVRDDAFLRSETLPDEDRYSLYSLPYYLMGVLDLDDMSAGSPKPVDGVSGPGFTKPLADGSFSQRGETFQALFDPAGKGRLTRPDAAAAAPDQGRITLVDRWKNPIRFYRWLPQTSSPIPGQGQVTQYLVPRVVGDPAKNPALRSARFAIVSTGADGRTCDEVTKRPLPTNGVASPAVDATPIDTAYTEDDIVEVAE